MFSLRLMFVFVFSVFTLLWLVLSDLFTFSFLFTLFDVLTLTLLLLGEFDAAVAAQKEANVGENAGRVLRKADVLEWDTERSGTAYDGALRERARIVNDLTTIFGSCPILSQKGTDSVVALYRS